MALVKQTATKKPERSVLGGRSRISATSALRTLKRSSSSRLLDVTVLSANEEKSGLGWFTKVGIRKKVEITVLSRGQRQTASLDFDKRRQDLLLTLAVESKPSTEVSLPPNPLSAIAAKIQSDPAHGVKLAVEAGILNDDGSLAKSYA